MLTDLYYTQQPKSEEGIRTVSCSNISQISPMTLSCTHKLRIIDIVYHASNNGVGLHQDPHARMVMGK